MPDFPAVFPSVIDNSMREAFTACPMKFFRGYVQNLTMPQISVHLHAGAAYAKGLEVMRGAFYDDGLSELDALTKGAEALIHAYGDFQPPPDSPKTVDRMVGALEYYTSQYPLDTDYIKPYKAGAEKSALEFTFGIPLPLRHPDTGEAIIYAGRFDMMGVMNNRDLIVYDDKTATQLGSSWAKKWHINSQFTGYAWAAKQFGFDIRAVVVRGVSILKTQYGTAEVIAYRPDWMIERWYCQLLVEIQRMIDMYKSMKAGNESAWPLSQADACSSYGGCMYTDLCDKQNPSQWIETQFITRHYDPLRVDD